MSLTWIGEGKVIRHLLVERNQNSVTLATEIVDFTRCLQRLLSQVGRSDRLAPLKSGLLVDKIYISSVSRGNFFVKRSHFFP